MVGPANIASMNGRGVRDKSPLLGKDGSKHVDTADNRDGQYWGSGAGSGDSYTWVLPEKPQAADSAREMRSYLRRFLGDNIVCDDTGETIDIEDVLPQTLASLQAKLWRDVPISRLIQAVAPAATFTANPEDDLILANLIRNIVRDLSNDSIFVVRHRNEAGLPICDHPSCAKLYQQFRIVPPAYVVMIEPVLDWDTVFPEDWNPLNSDILLFRRAPFNEIPGIDLRKVIPRDRLRFCMHCLKDLWARRFTAGFSPIPTPKNNEERALIPPILNSIEAFGLDPSATAGSKRSAEGSDEEKGYHGSSRAVQPDNNDSPSLAVSSISDRAATRDTGTETRSLKRPFGLDGTSDECQSCDLYEVPDSEEDANGEVYEVTTAWMVPKATTAIVHNHRKDSSSNFKLETILNLISAPPSSQEQDIRHNDKRQDEEIHSTLPELNYSDTVFVSSEGAFHSSPTQAAHPQQLLESLHEHRTNRSYGVLARTKLMGEAEKAGILVSSAQEAFLEQHELGTPRKGTKRPINSSPPGSPSLHKAEPFSSPARPNRQRSDSLRSESPFVTLKATPTSAEDREILEGIKDRIHRKRETLLAIRGASRRTEKESRAMKMEFINPTESDWIDETLQKHHNSIMTIRNDTPAPVDVPPPTPPHPTNLAQLKMRERTESLLALAKLFPPLPTCICRKPPKDGMVKCSNIDCLVQRYHYTCLTKSEKISSKNSLKWACTTCKLREPIKEVDDLAQLAANGREVMRELKKIARAWRGVDDEEEGEEMEWVYGSAEVLKLKTRPPTPDSVVPDDREEMDESGSDLAGEDLLEEEDLGSSDSYSEDDA